MATATPPTSPHPHDSRRTSKRTSTGDGASRYPSPPLDSFVIPPYNPNSRRRSTQHAQPVNGEHEAAAYAPMLGHDLPGAGSARGGLPAAGSGHRETRHRPASAAVVPVASANTSHTSVTSPSHNTSTSSRQGAETGRTRASHHIQSVGMGSSVTAPNTPLVPGGLAGMVALNHPMPRTRIYFGPYLLLQTLGEGEFGKVKLGVHSAPDRWGEEVAIKLIKRGNVDTQARSIKVQREIEVLKLVHHPNIVALHDVIETEKYIGIVLEYASGGELFDHILAHRYLREKDACKLFAQLISGVTYLHTKKIVHRDLKLENLLLDRNRNIIITDFGFANRFEQVGSDLMATSCGSPCYAAPELVVQDGRYVGSAVDVWSCGVILYAMLAGYLPFDDDPANPDGDNINLLYKYIINTQLSFPDWITAEPRDLLLRMLVPDPTRRCSLEDVARHPWLRRHTALFERSVEELEKTATEALAAKRESLQREKIMLAQQAMAANQNSTSASAGAMGRSQSSAGKGVIAGGQGSRGHQSAMITTMAPSNTVSDQLYSTSGPGTGVSGSQASSAHPLSQSFTPAPQPLSNQAPSTATSTASASNRRGHAQSAVVVPTTATSRAHAAVDSFSYGSTAPVQGVPGHIYETGVSSVPLSPSKLGSSTPATTTDREDVVMTDATAPSTTTTSRTEPKNAKSNGDSTAASKRRKAAARYTVQVEYDPRTNVAIVPSESPRERKRSTANGSNTGVPLEKVSSRTKSRDSSAVGPSPLHQRISASEAEDAGVAEQASAVLSGKTSYETAKNTMFSEPTPTGTDDEVSSKPDTIVENGYSTINSILSTPKASNGHPLTPQATPIASVGSPNGGPESVGLGTPTNTLSRLTELNISPGKRSASKGSTTSNASVPFPRPEKKANILASSTSNVTGHDSSRASLGSTTESQISNDTKKANRHRKGLSTDRFLSRLLGGSSSSIQKQSVPESPKVPTASSKSENLNTTSPSKTRRKALSMVVEPLSKNTSNNTKSRKSRMNDDGNGTTNITSISEKRRSRTSSAAPRTDVVPPTTTATQNRPPKVTNLIPERQPSQMSQAPSWAGSNINGVGKAKRVMDWFRFKSLADTPSSVPAPITTDFDRRNEARSRRDSKVPVPSRTSSSKPSTVKPIDSVGRAAAIIAETRRTPSVVITGSTPTDHVGKGGKSGRRGASGTTDGESHHHSSRSASGATTLTTSTTATSATNSSNQNTPLATVGGSVQSNGGSSGRSLQPLTPTSHAPSPSTVNTKPVVPFNDAKLKLHQGAIDQSALSGKSPPVLMSEIRQVLWDMGIDVIEENSMKLKATRRSRKKVAASLGLGVGALPGHVQQSPTLDRSAPLLSVSSSQQGGSGSGGSGVVVNGNGLSNSPSSTFRYLFQRKGSSHSVTALSVMTYTSPLPGDGIDIPMSPQPTCTSGQPLPSYAEDPSVDSGDDVRFTVEITKMKGFDGLYSVDIKRLRGSLWSFKYLYLQTLEKLALNTERR